MTETKLPDFRIDDVTVHVRSVQKSPDNESDNIEFFSAGSYYRRNGSYYIRYTEHGKDTDKVTTTVKVERDNVVTVMRSGAESYNLVLARGERRHALYRMQCGELLLGISEAVVRNELNEEGGDLHLEYLLDINNTVASRNTLDIHVQLLKN